MNCILNHQAADGPLKKKRRTNDDSDSKKKIEIANIDNSESHKKAKSIKYLTKHVPRFRLKTTGESALLTTSTNERVPLMLTDIQHLLLHSLLGNLNLSEQPRWYVLDKCGHISQTTCLILEGVSLTHWEKHKDKLIHTPSIFPNVIEILTPSVYKGSLVQELALVPLSEVEKEDIIMKYGSMNLALEARKDLISMMRAVFPIAGELSNTEVTPDIDPNAEDKFSRTQLLLSAWQLIEENYPLPIKGKLKDAYSDYVMTKDEFEPVTTTSPMFGLDCEMCMTNAGSELTRVSIVNEKHEIIYESLVKPYNDITDYLTRFSGITKSILDNVTKRLEDVQKDLRDLLPSDAILVGQSLNIDLHALKMMHPYVIDTSVIYNFTGTRPKKPKLKSLAREFLNKDIQSGKNGHCSVEDSITCLKLVQLKLSKSLEYGDAVHTNRQKYKEKVIKVIETPDVALSIFNHMIEKKKTSLIVGCDDITGDYHSYLTKAKESLCSQLKKSKPKKVKLNTMDSVEEVISNLSLAVHEYNFVMGHLKLELNSETELNQMQVIDQWIEKTWSSLQQCALFVVIFGGVSEDNGVGMIRIKNDSTRYNKFLSPGGRDSQALVSSASEPFGRAD